MKTCIALLRGINVGGKNSLPVKELVKTLEAAGCRNVRTYIQSGNAVFQAEEQDRSALARRICQRISEDHGFAPKVLLLAIDELREAMANNPYATEAGKALHFFFWAHHPLHPTWNDWLV